MKTIVERLRVQARRESEASRMMAESKSLRQKSNTEQRTDLYMWTKPEDTVSWKAAALITSQAAEIEGLRLSRLRAEEFGDAAFERVKVLEKALEPFARCADSMGERLTDRYELPTTSITMGHLRAARTALQHEGGGRG